MDRLAAQLQKGIEDGLLRILLGLRIGSVIGFLAGIWFTPWPWKLFAFGPYFLAPLMAAVTRRLPQSWFEPDQAAVEAERRRVRKILCE
jgi:ABC-type nitrate/sulfonate/bicarbonate transport system permease component